MEQNSAPINRPPVLVRIPLDCVIMANAPWNSFSYYNKGYFLIHTSIDGGHSALPGGVSSTWRFGLILICKSISWGSLPSATGWKNMHMKISPLLITTAPHSHSHARCKNSGVWSQHNRTEDWEMQVFHLPSKNKWHDEPALSLPKSTKICRWWPQGLGRKRSWRVSLPLLLVKI